MYFKFASISVSVIIMIIVQTITVHCCYAYAATCSVTFIHIILNNAWSYNTSETVPGVSPLEL